MATEKFGVVLHAGTSDTWTHDALYQEEVEKILKDIAETAGANLRSGAKAIDVVQAVVMSLEDCPFFNAGKGAVLNEDGEHEVSLLVRNLVAHQAKNMIITDSITLLAGGRNRRRCTERLRCCSGHSRN